MEDGLPDGLVVTLFPPTATWGSLRQLVRLADAMKVSDDAELGCSFNDMGDLEGITLGPGDGT